MLSSIENACRSTAPTPDGVQAVLLPNALVNTCNQPLPLLESSASEVDDKWLIRPALIEEVPVIRLDRYGYKPRSAPPVQNTEEQYWRTWKANVDETRFRLSELDDCSCLTNAARQRSGLAGSLYCSAFTDAERLIEFDQSIKVYLLGHGIAQLRYQFLRLPQATAINFKNLVHPLSVIARRAFAEPAILLITFIRAGYQLGDIALSFMTRRVIASRASNSIYVELLSTDE